MIASPALRHSFRNSSSSNRGSGNGGSGSDYSGYNSGGSYVSHHTSSHSSPSSHHSSGGGSGSRNNSRPIILDLAGTGINITEATRSNTFMDSDGSGLSHRTAWAGFGSAVLFYDLNGDSKITQKNQYVFTEWDPTAKDDMQALRDVFDTNGDGVFSALDAKWLSFKLMVTNADGTQTAKSFFDLGITSINLKLDTTEVAYSDGSAIEGQASYFTTGNVEHKGGVAATSLATDAKGYAVTTNNKRVRPRRRNYGSPRHGRRFLRFLPDSSPIRLTTGQHYESVRFGTGRA